MAQRKGRTRILGSAAVGGLSSGWFGYGQDGPLAIASGATETIKVEPHIGQVITYYQDVTIENGGKWTVSAPCNGAIMLVKGNLVVNGTIDMSYKSPLANDAEGAAKLESHIVLANTTQYGELLGGNGGRGGQSGGLGGYGTWNGGGYGGGGGPNGGDSEPRPPYGITWPWYGTTSGKQQYGAGAPNSLSTYTASGGAAPGGSMASVYRRTDERDGTNTRYATPGNNGNAYGGGALWIYVQGNVEIGANGKILANGGQGGAGTQSSQATYYADGDYGSSVTYNGSGGSGGGGIIFITYGGTFVNYGRDNILANGGEAPAPYNTSSEAKAVVGNAGTIGKVVIIPFQDLIQGS